VARAFGRLFPTLQNHPVITKHLEIGNNSERSGRSLRTIADLTGLIHVVNDLDPNLLEQYLGRPNRGGQSLDVVLEIRDVQNGLKWITTFGEIDDVSPTTPLPNPFRGWYYAAWAGVLTLKKATGLYSSVDPNDYVHGYQIGNENTRYSFDVIFIDGEN